MVIVPLSERLSHLDIEKTVKPLVWEMHDLLNRGTDPSSRLREVVRGWLPDVNLVLITRDDELYLVHYLQGEARYVPDSQELMRWLRLHSTPGALRQVLTAG